jgi:hypothetical protein
MPVPDILLEVLKKQKPDKGKSRALRIFPWGVF